jgi:hypothetical protein
MPPPWGGPSVSPRTPQPSGRSPTGAWHVLRVAVPARPRAAVQFWSGIPQTVVVDVAQVPLLAGLDALMTAGAVNVAGGYERRERLTPCTVSDTAAASCAALLLASQAPITGEGNPQREVTRRRPAKNAVMRGDEPL